MKKLHVAVSHFLRQDLLLRKNSATKAIALPENCYYLPHDAVLCYPRVNGDSRYPYSADGLTLWARSSGYISLNESTFYCILPSEEGKEPYAAFFGGVQRGEGFAPISITGVAQQANENVRRFTVFTPTAVYYVAQHKRVAFYVRAYMTQDKKTVFSVGATNNGIKTERIYLASYINFLFMHQAGEGPETRWFKKSTQTEHGYLLETVEDLDRYTHLKNFGVLNRHATGYVFDEHTCSRSDFVGGKNNSLCCATPLFEGHFSKQKKVCNFTDTAIAGDMFHFDLKAGESVIVDYVMQICPTLEAALGAVKEVKANYADSTLEIMTSDDMRKQRSVSMLKMRFADTREGELDAAAFSEFVSHVKRQTEFAALAKNSGVSMLGVRDVTQQLEAALMWNPTACRAKILEVLSYIDPSGRAPRQYSIPAPNALPRMDTREFVDQGNWIVSALYTYLSYTGDYSILNEKCGYYKIVAPNRVEAVKERNSVYEHLVRITDYLLSNVDEQTHCLKILYGDWNDAVDGLGVPLDSKSEYGSGVSVMATLHLYQNLQQMLEITDKYDKASQRRNRYIEAREQLKQGLLHFGVERKGDCRKILHGWGDKRSYTVGGFCDMDGKNRDGLTANAFWVISGAYTLDKSIKKDILRSYDRLDGKYGLRTFEPGFDEDAKGVGRIVNLPLGTAENGATYVHSAMFGIWSLFEMNESERGWKQLEKVLPITHNYLTTTPFVMSNSYSFNPQLGMDGESMNDWFTGSANALIKLLVWYVFGVKCDLEGVMVAPANYFPFGEAELSVRIKGKTLKVLYKKQNLPHRRFVLNGKDVQPVTAPNDIASLRIDDGEMLPTTLVEIFD